MTNFTLSVGKLVPGENEVLVWKWRTLKFGIVPSHTSGGVQHSGQYRISAIQCNLQVPIQDLWSQWEWVGTISKLSGFFVLVVVCFVGCGVGVFSLQNCLSLSHSSPIRWSFKKTWWYLECWDFSEVKSCSKNTLLLCKIKCGNWSMTKHSDVLRILQHTTVIRWTTQTY